MDYGVGAREQEADAAPDIVVVDDNTDNLRVLSGILKNQGYSPRPVSSGRTAINAISAKPPDMVLLDIMMPETDGFNVCGQLKSDPNTRDIPVIFISALDELEEKLKAFAMGGVDYITKPFQEAEVLARIETHLALVRAKEALQKSEIRNRRLKKSESLVRMAGAIAHQFNNHLHAVLGNLEMAQIYLPDEEKSARTISAAIESAQKAAKVSRLMLTYTGQTEGELAAMDLADFCRMNLPLFKADMPEHIVFDASCSSPGAVIMGNAPLLEQMTTHLLANAREAMAGRPGKIHLAVKTVTSMEIPVFHRFPVNWRPADAPHACLEISDQGKGIAEKDLENIFDPFFSTHFPGRGLGLSVALGIASAHNAGITVESRQGKGSIFRVFFPVSRSAIQPSDDSAMQEPPVAKGSMVLVVEDEEFVRNLIADYLEQMGYRVMAASCGEEAVEMFSRHKKDIRCVITDFAMPGMDGWETIASLRSMSPNIYVILSSGFDEARVMEGAGDELPQAFLRKPYNLKALAHAVSKGFAADRNVDS